MDKNIFTYDRLDKTTNLFYSCQNMWSKQQGILRKMMPSIQLFKGQIAIVP